MKSGNYKIISGNLNRKDAKLYDTTLEILKNNAFSLIIHKYLRVFIHKYLREILYKKKLK